MDKDDLFNLYISLLTKWNAKINLVQKNTLPNVVHRHIEDCLQLSTLLAKSDKILDIGSGAGLPGAILSMCGFKDVTLCEKNFKKCVFLQELKAKLDLKFAIYNGNIYDFIVPSEESQRVVAVSRAFGSLEKLLGIMLHLGICRGVFHKGELYEKEIEDAKKVFQFDCQIIPSKTNKNGVIIDVQNIRRI